VLGFFPLALLAACPPYPTSPPPPLLWFRPANLITLRPAGLPCASKFHFGGQLPKFHLDVLAMTLVPHLTTWSLWWKFVSGLAPRCQGGTLVWGHCLSSARSILLLLYCKYYIMLLPFLYILLLLKLLCFITFDILLCRCTAGARAQRGRCTVKRRFNNRMGGFTLNVA
jgi:hypothetical protein